MFSEGNLTPKLRPHVRVGIQASTGVFDTPEAAPDFDALRELFLRGELVIRNQPPPAEPVV